MASLYIAQSMLKKLWFPPYTHKKKNSTEEMCHEFT